MNFLTKLFLVLLWHLASGLPYECSTGFWGSKCTKTCGECDGGPWFCHVHDGRCVNGCAPGFAGVMCKTSCPAGTHGQYCKYTCGNCSDVQPVCDVVTGECKGGCKPGLQEPFCKMVCPYMHWGNDCEGKCDCPIGVSCGCHHISGDCQPCGSGGDPIDFTLKEPGSLCFNPFLLEKHRNVYARTNYPVSISPQNSSLPSTSTVPPPPQLYLLHLQTVCPVHKSVLEIPWVPIASFMGLIVAFILFNFVYWYCWVKKPSEEKTVRIVRGAKPVMQVLSWEAVWEKMNDVGIEKIPASDKSFRPANVNQFSVLDRYVDRVMRKHENRKTGKKSSIPKSENRKIASDKGSLLFQTGTQQDQRQSEQEVRLIQRSRVGLSQTYYDAIEAGSERAITRMSRKILDAAKSSLHLK